MRAAEAEGGGGFDAAEASRVVETLVRYYGVTMHGDIFNCDPHPGNLLVDRASGDLVVLDWGQARRLSATERAAHARLFLAIMMEDVNLLGDACAARPALGSVKLGLARPSPGPHLTLIEPNFGAGAPGSARPSATSPPHPTRRPRRCSVLTPTLTLTWLA